MLEVKMTESGIIIAEECSLDVDLDPVDMAMAAQRAVVATAHFYADMATWYSDSPLVDMAYMHRDKLLTGMEEWMDDIVEKGKVPERLIYGEEGGLFVSREGKAIIACILALNAGNVSAVEQIADIAMGGNIDDEIFISHTTYPWWMKDSLSVLHSVSEKCRTWWRFVAKMCLDKGHAPAGITLELLNLAGGIDGEISQEMFNQYLLRKLQNGRLIMGTIPTDGGIVTSGVLLPG